MNKPTSVANMLFALTPKDHTIAIANKDLLAMDSIAQVRNENTVCYEFAALRRPIHLLFSLKAYELSVFLLHNITNDGDDDVYVT